MKKISLIVLAFIICILVCSCSNSLEGETWTYSIGVNYDCTARFSNGTLYLDVFGDLQIYNYTLDGNTITLNNTITYTYEIDNNTVKFNSDLMGVSDVWYKQ